MITQSDLEALADDLGLEYAPIKAELEHSIVGGILTTVHGMDIEVVLKNVPGRTDYGSVNVKDIDDDWDCREYIMITSLDDVRGALIDPSKVLDPFHGDEAYQELANEMNQRMKEYIDEHGSLDPNDFDPE